MASSPRSGPLSILRVLPTCCIAVTFGSSVPVARAEEPVGLRTVNEAAFAPPTPGLSAVVLKAAILLDRAGFSSGAIDGLAGETFGKAVAAFQARQDLAQTAGLDEPTWNALIGSSPEPVLQEYQITAADTRGPFIGSLPERLEDQARLKRLSYTGPREMLAERFHMAESLLAALNPNAAFDQPGTRIVVAQTARKRAAKVARIEVDKDERSLRAYDEAGAMVGFYPVSIGSDEKVSPTGTFTIRRVARGPVFEYNPRYAFKEVASARHFSVAAGPNNPVGTVWIDFQLRSYGIHGTPDPESVGKAASHGCVRMTNWDVEALAAMVSKGTIISFLDKLMPTTASMP